MALPSTPTFSVLGLVIFLYWNPLLAQLLNVHPRSSHHYTGRVTARTGHGSVVIPFFHGFYFSHHLSRGIELPAKMQCSISCSSLSNSYMYVRILL